MPIFLSSLLRRLGLAALCLLVASCALAEPTNQLRNPQFAEVENNLPVGWTAFEGGFVLAPASGHKGDGAVTMTRQKEDKARGVSQYVALNQQTPAPITIAGWSRGQDVSGTADNNYAVFADLTFADGTNGWGYFAPFETGTSDWKRAQLEIKPEKAVKSLLFYALFREHSGQVWFSDLTVSAESPPKPATAPPQNLVAVNGQKTLVPQPFIAQFPEQDAVFKVVPLQHDNRLVNPRWESTTQGEAANWQKWGEGFAVREGEGRGGSRAAFIARAAKDGERGLWQDVILDQKTAAPILLSGWSRAEGVTGTPDSDYSLYADLTFQDGTQLWGESAPFGTGTHDWQQVRHLISPEKPVKSLRFYGLFRAHTGSVWFSDLSVGSALPPPGTALFDSLAVQNQPQAQVPVPGKATAYSTKDGLTVEMQGGRVMGVRLDGRDMSSGARGGFLVRDVANSSNFYPLRGGRDEELKLELETQVSAASDHIAIEGRVSDLSGRDRALSLVFALPVDARGWSWGQTMRESQTVGTDELSNTVPFFAGSNGRHSLYPLANIHDEKSGLAVALDPEFAAQTRLAVNGATRQFYVVYDFGLTPEKSDASFRFVIYRTDPQWGFRDALAKMGHIFPATFAVRGANEKQGLWMPFTDVNRVQGWQDFGFRYHEGNQSVKWDDDNGILSFRYHEPMTWWMNIPAGSPRTYENALSLLQEAASDAKSPSYNQARAVLSSGFRDATGRYAVSFRDAPWSSGAVWSLNPDPKIPGESTGASLGWSGATRDALYKNNSSGDLDGEYLDSLEGYVTANLNFDREHFKGSHAPLTFDTATSVPAQHKALLVYDYLRWESRDVHSLGKLMFANSVPYRFSFLTPYLDVMGTETDWMPGGNWTPDDDALMSLRRALSGAKPYLLLQNTNFDAFTSAYVEKYMQRALFYGMFPGFFSADAASKPYWLNPAWYNRDRPLFKKYLPMIKPVAEAGWQAVTLATSDNANIWIERFGEPNGPLYLTLRNNASTAQTAKVRLQLPLKAPLQLRDSVSQQDVAVKAGVIEISLLPDQTAVLKLH